MTGVLIEHDPSPMKLEVLGVDGWPTRSDPVSVQAISYECTETSLLIAGHAVITPEDGEPVEAREGDLVICLGGITCVWDIKETVIRHYKDG